MPVLLAVVVLLSTLLEGPCASAAVSLEATCAGLQLAGNVQFGNPVNPNGEGGQPPDNNISALIITNGLGLSGTNSIFEYTPSSNAASYQGGSTYTGLAGIRAACLDAYETGWNFQPPFITGANGLPELNPACTTGIYAAGGNTNLGGIGVGYMTAAEYAARLDHPATFGGVQMSAAGTNSVVLRATYAGDTTLKGYVDTSDYGNWMAGYKQTLKHQGPTDWAQGDFNYDGSTDLSDYQIWLAGYVQHPNNGSPLGSLGDASGGGPLGSGTATAHPASITIARNQSVTATDLWAASRSAVAAARTPLRPSTPSGALFVAPATAASAPPPRAAQPAAMSAPVAAPAGSMQPAVGGGNANFMYFLEPVPGGTAAYTTTFTPNPLGVGSWSVKLGAGSTAGQTVEMLLYAAVPGTSRHGVGWGGMDYLNITNSAATGSGTLIGTFTTDGSTVNNPLVSTGQAGVVGLNGDPALDLYAGNAANLAWYGGQLNTTRSGAGWVGGPSQIVSTANATTYVTPCGADSFHSDGAVLETSASGVLYHVAPISPATGNTLAGASWYDIPLGTLYYELAATPTNGQTAAIDVSQAFDADGTYYGAYFYSSSAGTGAAVNQQSMADQPVSILYGSATPEPGTLALLAAAAACGLSAALRRAKLATRSAGARFARGE
jgi:hypothetical protein